MTSPWLPWPKYGIQAEESPSITSLWAGALSPQIPQSAEAERGLSPGKPENAWRTVTVTSTLLRSRTSTKRFARPAFRPKPTIRFVGVPTEGPLQPNKSHTRKVGIHSVETRPLGATTSDVGRYRKDRWSSNRRPCETACFRHRRPVSAPTGEGTVGEWTRTPGLEARATWAWELPAEGLTPSRTNQETLRPARPRGLGRGRARWRCLIRLKEKRAWTTTRAACRASRTRRAHATTARGSFQRPRTWRARHPEVAAPARAATAGGAPPVSRSAVSAANARSPGRQVRKVCE